MANIIATLENKNGDTIYPVAGAMAGDSVTTAMVQDGAVTADKVNLATFKNALAPGDSVSVVGDNQQNIRYPGQWDGTNNRIDVFIPFNFLVRGDVEGLTVSSTDTAVTLFPAGASSTNVTINSIAMISYAYQTGAIMRIVPSSTMTHDPNQFVGVRIPHLTITAA